MNTTKVLLNPQGFPYAKTIAKTAFPEYKGRKYSIEYVESVGMYDTFWDGGSRSEYRVVELSTGKVRHQHSAMNDPAELGGIGGRENRCPVPEGYAIVQHSIFCGRDVGCTVYLPAKKGLESGT